MKEARILVSGATGFLGHHVVERLKGFGQVTLLSRSANNAMRADLSQWNGQLEPQDLKGKFDIFLHMAGLYNLRINELEGLKQNVMTTHSALAIAQKAEIPHFIHVSTVAVVVGLDTLYARPDDVKPVFRFPDWYAHSKMLAEHMVRYWDDGPKSKTILRLGVLVGDTDKGKILRIDGPYHAAEGIKQIQGLIESFPTAFPLPGNKRTRIPLVPVNKAGWAISQICKHVKQENWEGTKYLYLAPNRGVGAEELFTSTFRHLGIKKEFSLVERVPRSLLESVAEKLAHLPREEVSYLLDLPPLDLTETQKILGVDWCPEFSEYESIFWKGYDQYVSNR